MDKVPEPLKTYVPKSASPAGSYGQARWFIDWSPPLEKVKRFNRTTQILWREDGGCQGNNRTVHQIPRKRERLPAAKVCSRREFFLVKGIESARMRAGHSGDAF